MHGNAPVLVSAARAGGLETLNALLQAEHFVAEIDRSAINIPFMFLVHYYAFYFIVLDPGVCFCCPLLPVVSCPWCVCGSIPSSDFSLWIHSLRIPRSGPLGTNALHLAVWRNHEGLLEALLNAGADPNVGDEESGWTPLHKAFYWGNLRQAVRLLKADASMDQVDHRDRTALDILSEDLSSYLPLSGPGEVFAWGSDATYALGIASTSGERSLQPHPVRVEALHGKGVVQLAAAKFHSCAVDQDGNLWTWGWGLGGRLGHADSHIHSGSRAVIAPRLVTSLGRRRVASIAAAKHHTLVCTTSGEVFSFGSNKYSQLGYSGVDTQPEPRRVSSLRCRIVAVAAANKHSAAVSSTGEVFTWGGNALGQLGYGTVDSASSGVPRVVEALKGRRAMSVAAAKRHTLVLTADGEVFTFGHRGVSPRRVLLAGCRDTAIGDGRTLKFHRGHAEVVRPVAVAIAAGAAHSSALTSTGVVLTWRSADPALLVQEVCGLLSSKKVVSISAGKYRTAVVTADGNVFCWEGRSDFFPADGRQSGSGSTKGQKSKITGPGRHRFVPIPKQENPKCLSGQGTPTNGPGIALQQRTPGSDSYSKTDGVGTPRQRLFGTSPLLNGCSPVGSFGSSVRSNGGYDVSSSFLERVFAAKRDGCSIGSSNLSIRDDGNVCSARMRDESDFKPIIPQRVPNIKRAGLVVVGEKHTLALQRWSVVQLDALPIVPWLFNHYKPIKAAEKGYHDEFNQESDLFEKDLNDSDTELEQTIAESPDVGNDIHIQTNSSRGEADIGVISLQNLCEAAVACQLVDPRTALQVLEYADLAGADLLKAYCQMVAVCNLDAVLVEARGAFEELPYHLLADVERIFKSRFSIKTFGAKEAFDLDTIDNEKGGVTTEMLERSNIGSGGEGEIHSSILFHSVEASSERYHPKSQETSSGLMTLDQHQQSRHRLPPGEVTAHSVRPTAAQQCMGDFKHENTGYINVVHRSAANEAAARGGKSRIRLTSKSSFKDLAAVHEEEAIHRLERSLMKKLQQIESLEEKLHNDVPLDVQQMTKISQRPIFMSALAALDDGMPPEEVQALLQAATRAMETRRTTTDDAMSATCSKHKQSCPSKGPHGAHSRNEGHVEQSVVALSGPSRQEEQREVAESSKNASNEKARSAGKKKSRNRRRSSRRGSEDPVPFSMHTATGEDVKSEHVDQSQKISSARLGENESNRNGGETTSTGYFGLPSSAHKTWAISEAGENSGGSTNIAPSSQGLQPKTHIIGFDSTYDATKGNATPSAAWSENESAAHDIAMKLPSAAVKPRRGGLSMFLRGELDASSAPSWRKENSSPGQKTGIAVGKDGEQSCVWGKRVSSQDPPMVASLKDIQKEQGSASKASLAKVSTDARKDLKPHGKVGKSYQSKQTKSSQPQSSGIRLTLDAFLANSSASLSSKKSSPWGQVDAVKISSGPSLKDIQEEQERRRQLMLGSSPPAARLSWGSQHLGGKCHPANVLSTTATGASPSGQCSSSSVFGSSPSGSNPFYASPIPAQSKWFVPEEEEIEQRRFKPFKAIQAEESAIKELVGLYGAGNVRIVKK